MERSKKCVCGILFDDITQEKMTDVIFSLAESKGSCTVFTPNAEIAETARNDPNFLRLLNSADVSAADGDGILLAAALTGSFIQSGKTAGVELGYRVAEACSARGYRLFLLGGKPDVCRCAAEKLSSRYPKLVIAGFCDGYASLPDAAQKIKNSRADAVFVCLGSPLQEQWIRENHQDGAKIHLALGGSLDIYAGKAIRAPKIFRKMHLEWFWRLILSPSRLRRMLKIPRFLCAALREGMKNELQSFGGAENSNICDI